MANSKKQHRTVARGALRRFLHNRMAVVGLVIFLCIVALTVYAVFAVDFDSTTAIDPPNRLQPPSAAHWFGTDEMGRDIFARILYGARYTLSISFAATLVAVVIGGIFGAAAGYVGGQVDTLIMSVMDVFMCLPSMLLAIAIVVALGNSVGNLIWAIGVSNIPKFARIVRSSVLSVRNTEYVQAAQVIGTPVIRIIFGHILRNCLGPVIVQATLIFAMAILSVSSLSFLGLGISSPTPEWGNMLSSARANMRNHAYMVIAPGMAILLSIFSLNLLGDGLRDAIDPKMEL